MRIEKGLQKLNGVTESQVNLATERATVHYQSSVIALEQIIGKVEALGYNAHPFFRQGNNCQEAGQGLPSHKTTAQ